MKRILASNIPSSITQIDTDFLKELIWGSTLTKSLQRVKMVMVDVRARDSGDGGVSPAARASYTISDEGIVSIEALTNPHLNTKNDKRSQMRVSKSHAHAHPLPQRNGTRYLITWGPYQRSVAVSSSTSSSNAACRHRSCWISRRAGP